MREIQCPSCGGPVQVKSARASTISCTYCGSSIVDRGDIAVLADEIAQQERALNCPTCSGPLVAKMGAATATIGCRYCYCTLDVQADRNDVAAPFSGAVVPQPIFPLGHAGRLDDAIWQVVGFVRRVDLDSGTEWSEYVLYHPGAGVGTLWHRDGAFVWGQEVEQVPTGGAADERRCRAQLDFVLGELPWPGRVGDVSTVTRSVLPDGRQLVTETADDGAVAFSGHVLDESEARAFYPALATGAMAQSGEGSVTQATALLAEHMGVDAAKIASMSPPAAEKSGLIRALSMVAKIGVAGLILYKLAELL